MENSNYEKALNYYKKTLAIYLGTLGPNHKKTGYIYNNIGIVNGVIWKFNDAIKYYEKSAKIKIKNLGENHVSLAYTYVNMGLIYKNLKDFNHALYYFQMALSILKKQKDLRGLKAVYQNLGTVYLDKGEYDKAFSYYKKSLDIGLKYYGKRNQEIGDLYTLLGNVYLNKEDNDKALNYYKKALQIYKDIFGENNDNVASAYDNIGNVFGRKNRSDMALKYYNKSLTIRNSLVDEHTLSIEGSYDNIANLYFEKANYKDALKHYIKTLRVLNNIYGEQHIFNTFYYIKIATIYNEQQKYEKAISYFEKAFISNSRNNNHKDVQTAFDIDNYYDYKLLLETLQGKSKTLQSLSLKYKDFEYLNKSIVTYQKAEFLIENIRKSFQNYQDKILFNRQAKEVYSNAIQSQLLVYNHKKEWQILDKVFHYSEKSKSNTLKDLLNDANAKNFSGIPDDLIQQEKNLKINKAFYRSKINEELANKVSDSTKINTYESKLFDINRKQDSITQLLEKNYPKYHQLKYNNEVVSVAEIQQKLDDHTTLLEFFTADSSTYAFTISKHKIDVKELATPKLTQKVEQLRTTITRKNTTTYKTQAYKLYKTLIAPIKDQLVGENLIIVPDGPLWHLNFELLVNQEDVSNNPKELSYLLKDYVITYANSATLFFNQKIVSTNNKTKQQEECLAFSFTDSTNIADATHMSLATLRDTGDDLPGTRKEIKAIADIIDGQYYYGSEAVEANFKKNASHYNILHLALHGEVDNERPENSKLFFTRNKDTIEDNLLYSHELFALDIPAELTVLSACNTGTGKIAKGEGIMSLGTAFQYAGTKSLLLTNWEVSDQTTPALMKNFYTNLKEGMNKGKALQQAKLTYLQSAAPERTHPFYWGGFYLVGDPAPIAFSTHNYSDWVIGIAIVILILSGAFWYRKKKKQFPLLRGVRGVFNI
ncbi:CHAT domain-containing protein [Aquimarina sp. RZ0]|uniref:CHAT domain-containing protein n=1 Tax=Aquimarina sp. RZ0 TaxID=2607730 RepID=UPI0011F1DA01|nr:CHAT domain-containing tetratricopeptide repeat protein [Aquimarina sp. RZ0]KAA1247318.1 CHAT domain-containing protein [Aquimarina sp. RZ0]